MSEKLRPPDASKVELGYTPDGDSDRPSAPEKSDATNKENKADKKKTPRKGPRRGAAVRSALAITFSQLRRNRMARIGAVALACIALLTVFADLLASELPIACRLHGRTYLLPNVTHPRELAGYDNARIDAEKAGGDWSIHPFVAFGPNQSGPVAVVRGTLSHADALRPPSPFGAHPLGTDAYGRDLFARLVHGTRTSIGAAVLAALGFVLIGTALGALAGFFGGLFDSIVARLVETLSAFPTLVLVLVVQAVLARPSMMSLLLAIGLTRWPEVARLVRAEVLLVSAQDYVVAARALGASPSRVLARHVFPNAFAPILVAATFGIASVVLIEASLDFLRVGIPPGSASWGETLSETREHLGAWWLLVFPGLAVFVTVMALNLVGEALRDALDPRLRAVATGVAEREIPRSSTAFDETTHA